MLSSVTSITSSLCHLFSPPGEIVVVRRSTDEWRYAQVISTSETGVQLRVGPGLTKDVATRVLSTHLGRLPPLSSLSHTSSLSPPRSLTQNLPGSSMYTEGSARARNAGGFTTPPRSGIHSHAVKARDGGGSSHLVISASGSFKRDVIDSSAVASASVNNSAGGSGNHYRQLSPPRERHRPSILDPTSPTLRSQLQGTAAFESMRSLSASDRFLPSQVAGSSPAGNSRAGNPAGATAAASVAGGGSDNTLLPSLEARGSLAATASAGSNTDITVAAPIAGRGSSSTSSLPTARQNALVGRTSSPDSTLVPHHPSSSSPIDPPVSPTSTAPSSALLCTAQQGEEYSQPVTHQIDCSIDVRASGSSSNLSHANSNTDHRQGYSATSNNNSSSATSGASGGGGVSARNRRSPGVRHLSPRRLPSLVSSHEPSLPLPPPLAPRTRSTSPEPKSPTDEGLGFATPAAAAGSGDSNIQNPSSGSNPSSPVGDKGGTGAGVEMVDADGGASREVRRASARGPAGSGGSGSSHRTSVARSVRSSLSRGALGSRSFSSSSSLSVPSSGSTFGSLSFSSRSSSLSHPSAVVPASASGSAVGDACDASGSRHLTAEDGWLPSVEEQWEEGQGGAVDGAAAAYGMSVPVASRVSSSCVLPGGPMASPATPADTLGKSAAQIEACAVWQTGCPSSSSGSRTQPPVASGEGTTAGVRSKRERQQGREESKEERRERSGHVDRVRRLGKDVVVAAAADNQAAIQQSLQQSLHPASGGSVSASASTGMQQEHQLQHGGAQPRAIGGVAAPAAPAVPPSALPLHAARAEVGAEALPLHLARAATAAAINIVTAATAGGGGGGAAAVLAAATSTIAAAGTAEASAPSVDAGVSPHILQAHSAVLVDEVQPHSSRVRQEQRQHQLQQPPSQQQRQEHRHHRHHRHQLQQQQHQQQSQPPHQPPQLLPHQQHHGVRQRHSTAEVRSPAATPSPTITPPASTPTSPKTQNPNSSSPIPSDGEEERGLLPWQKEHCPICLETMGRGRALFAPECGHLCHFSCIRENIRHGNLCCPLCRYMVAIEWHSPLQRLLLGKRV